SGIGSVTSPGGSFGNLDETETGAPYRLKFKRSLGLKFEAVLGAFTEELASEVVGFVELCRPIVGSSDRRSAQNSVESSRPSGGVEAHQTGGGRLWQRREESRPYAAALPPNANGLVTEDLASYRRCRFDGRTRVCVYGDACDGGACRWSRPPRQPVVLHRRGHAPRLSPLRGGRHERSPGQDRCRQREPALQHDLVSCR